MTIEKSKKLIKPGSVLMDDCDLLYDVVDVFPNSCAVTVVKERGSDFACEIVTFACIENEDWKLVKIVE